MRWFGWFRKPLEPIVVKLECGTMTIPAEDWPLAEPLVVMLMQREAARKPDAFEAALLTMERK